MYSDIATPKSVQRDRPVGVFGKGYRAERRNMARIVRRRTGQGRTISDTMRIIQAAHANASAA